jgi:3-phenylpropionate/cinnamic acid dioxygenase small subunit
MQAPLDPSRSSYYISDALYRDLIANFSEWQDDALAVTDVFVRDEFRQLLEREARLLDQLRYDEWLAMYAPECVYWVPSTPNRGDPRREIAIMFDDRRRVEVFSTACADKRMLRSNFLISEFWGDETRQLTGWAGHRVARGEGGWKITAKQVNLIECDQSIRNPSIIL